MWSTRRGSIPRSIILLGNDSTATGSATFQPNADGTAVSYVLNVADLENVTMAHIHVSTEPGGNGGVVVWLYPAAPPASLIPGSFTGVLGESDYGVDGDWVRACSCCPIPV
ncbi:MAG: CHRD domain-containing protein [Planctomycetes bacterium]|nr:CHRD domain-containing protein [Planctomycetota bacterium]